MTTTTTTQIVISHPLIALACVIGIIASIAWALWSFAVESDRHKAQIEDLEEGLGVLRAELQTCSAQARIDAKATRATEAMLEEAVSTAIAAQVDDQK